MKCLLASRRVHLHYSFQFSAGKRPGAHWEPLANTVGSILWTELGGLSTVPQSVLLIQSARESFIITAASTTFVLLSPHSGEYLDFFLCWSSLSVRGTSIHSLVRPHLAEMQKVIVALCDSGQVSIATAAMLPIPRNCRPCLNCCFKN